MDISAHNKIMMHTYFDVFKELEKETKCRSNHPSTL